MAAPLVDASAAVLRLGTRGSALALAQSGLVADQLRALGAVVETVVVRTAGDDRPPDTVWGEGAFVMALEEALLDGRVDVAVHSAKDVPTAEDPRLAIAAYPTREDPRDALVCREPGATLATLPAGALVGTDSPRRVAFLRAARPDLRTRPLHGNVDTRLRKLAAGEADALVLAVAGLARLGLADRISEPLPAEVALPAPGQGALAIQVRSDDRVARPLVERLDDAATRAAVEAERAFLRASGGGCRAPLGALAEVTGGVIVLRGGVSTEGSVVRGDAPAAQAAALAPGSTFTRDASSVLAAPIVARGERRGPVAAGPRLAAQLAAELADVLSGQEPETPVHVGASAARRVLATREPGGRGELVTALAAHGIETVVVPTIELRPTAPGGALDDAVANVGRYAWVVVTSPAGAAALAVAAARTGTDLRRARMAAVGGSTAATLGEASVTAAFRPQRADGEALGEELPLDPGARVLLARADAADDRLPDRLRERGAIVDEVVAYHTVEAPDAARDPLRRAFAEGDLGAIVFSSGSAVRGLLALLAPLQRRAALRLPACCIGPSTAAAAREAGFERVVEAAAPTPTAIADSVAAFVAGSPAAAATEVLR